MACIYQIRNLVNNKIYIGSTIRPLYIRKYEHFSELKKTKHANQYLQNSFNKYGKENFVLEVLEEIKFPEKYTKILKSEYIVGRELYLVELLNAEYNMRREVSTGTSGYRHSEETKRKISEANKKAIVQKSTLISRDREERRKNGDLNFILSKPKKPKKEKVYWPKGSKHTPEAIEKIKQRSLQEDNKIRIREIQKIAANNRIGSHHSNESKLKIINTKFGNRIIEIYLKDGELFSTCNFSLEASKITGVKRNAISNNLCGISKYAGDYIFKYKILD